jgi:hypothetical protein
VQDDGTLVGANLNVGGSSATATNVKLTGDDKLLATLDGEQKQLEKNLEIIDLNDPHYSAFWQGVTDPGAELLVAFERTVDEGAPSSTVSLPSNIAADVPEGTLSRADAEIVVGFSAAGEDESTLVEITGDCFQSASQTANGAATSLTFAPGALKEPEDDGETEEPAPAPTSCEAKIAITRTRTGAIDPAFGEGGLIQAVRRDEHTFTSAP